MLWTFPYQRVSLSKHLTQMSPKGFAEATVPCPLVISETDSHVFPCFVVMRLMLYDSYLNKVGVGGNTEGTLLNKL